MANEAEQLPQWGGARFKAIIDSFADPLMLVDSDGIIRYANPAVMRTLGFSEPDVLARQLRDFIPPDDREVVLAKLAALTHAGDKVFAEHRLLRADGRTDIAETTATPLSDPTGRPLLLLHFRCVTEQRKLEAQLVQHQKMELVGRLAAGIAHDFNNLLTVINAIAELEADTLPPADPHRGGYQTILEAAQRATALTKQLLALGRKQSTLPREISLPDTVRQLAAMLHRAAGPQVALEIHTLGQAARILADPAQIDQIVLNLVVNARDAMPDGGTVTIEITETFLDEAGAEAHPGVTPGPYVVLSVTDTGTGMDEETQAHIFEPYFTSKPPEIGSGLGLATVYGIVEQSGAHIWCQSEPGQGTTFFIYFPRVSPSNGPDERCAPERTR